MLTRGVTLIHLIRRDILHVQTQQGMCGFDFAGELGRASTSTGTGTRAARFVAFADGWIPGTMVGAGAGAGMAMASGSGEFLRELGEVDVVGFWGSVGD